ncbi:hypothetical protein ILUMI_15569 [Ignelater luminosus]|uniref:Uncharacterized protein n=1 Tax=Ignelater luminosus TaxID=2038154 RepID=A0A8K0CNB8_IGNLU|nr:hypothetical protein ILUMI_15569 [Ignelater luminosus]
MSAVPKIHEPKNLTDVEMLMLLDNDDSEFHDFLQEEDRDEESDRVSVDEDENGLKQLECKCTPLGSYRKRHRLGG